MKFKVEDKVRELGVKIYGVVIEGLDNKTKTEEYENFRKKSVEELLDEFKDFDIKTDPILEGFNILHDHANVKRRKNIPASENLIRLFQKNQNLYEINKVVDIYNIISMKTKLALGAHDIDKVDGNITLKITDGTEKFFPIGAEEQKVLNAGEYSFVDDSNDVICWLDIRQVDKTKVTEESKNILYLIIGNQENSYQELENVANEISDITTKYCGGKVTILKE